MVNNGMTIKFITRIGFLFEGWNVVRGNDSTFWMVCLVVFAYCVLYMNLITLKGLISKKLYAQLIWYFVYALSGIIVMQFIMTMNGFINIAVILGSTVGYALQQQFEDLIDRKITVPPGGCEFCG